MQYKLTIAPDDLFLEVLTPRNQPLPEFTLYIEDTPLCVFQTSPVSFIKKFKHRLSLSTKPNQNNALLPSTIKELLPVFGGKTLIRTQFHFHISSKIKAYIHNADSLYIIANGEKLVVNTNSLVIDDLKYQLPFLQLKTNISSFLCFNKHGEFVSNDLSILSSGFSIEVNKAKKNTLKFMFSGPANSLSNLLHKNVDIFLDDLKFGVASIQHQENDKEILQFMFNLNSDLVNELTIFHYLRIKISNKFYYIPDSLFITKLDALKIPNKIEPRSHKLLNKGFLLNKKGKLVETKENDVNWLKNTLALYHRADTTFEKEFGYELYITGGTLLGYARTGGVIGFDKDFDSGYISRFSNPEDIKQEFKKIILTLLKLGEDIRLITRVGRKFRCDYFMWFDKTGEHIDVFPAAFINGFYRRPTFVNTTLTASDIYPLKHALFDGYAVKVPNNFKKKVAAVYGEAWHSPDPFWKKIKSSEIIEYRISIMLTKEDFLEIAEYSQHDGEFIRETIANNDFKIQF
jgi:hypothetical protein